MKVTVIGAGIIGTTTAYRIKYKYPDVDMTIVADKFSPNTTSDIAAGWWEPHLDPDTPQDLTVQWSIQTYTFLLALWRGQHIQEVEDIKEGLLKGLSMTNGLFVDGDSSSSKPPWSDQVLSYIEHADPKKLTKLGFSESDQMTASSFLSFTFQPNIVLPVFYGWLKKQGVIFKETKLDCLEDLEESQDVVINCTGLGSAKLVNDDNLFPISGHVIRAKVPNIHHCLCDGRSDSWAYLIPNRECVILGSVDVPNNYNTDILPQNTQKIIKSCQRLCPHIQESSIMNESVGLRPCRRGGVRLEQDYNYSGKHGKVVHNYGHGGSGITLSWGCAKQVLDIFTHIHQG